MYELYNDDNDNTSFNLLSPLLVPSIEPGPSLFHPVLLIRRVSILMQYRDSQECFSAGIIWSLQLEQSDVHNRAWSFSFHPVLLCNSNLTPSQGVNSLHSVHRLSRVI